MDFPKLFLIILVFSPPLAAVAHNDGSPEKNYLIIVRKPYDYDTSKFKDVASWHASLLASVCDMAAMELAADPSSASHLIYSYRHVVNGFSARITDKELEAMSKKDWFVRAIPEQTYKLMTTHTPQFLGLSGRRDSVWNTSNMGEGMIIGVIDDGITPGLPSFDDKGMPPPPAKWKGRCDFNSSMCNNKLIGARSFIESAKWKWKGLVDPVLPINQGSHGTHTASTAAGAFVPGAGILGNMYGVASGMAPRAHIAFYQVCVDKMGCDRDDILAAMDEAVDDGVDVLSLSLGDDASKPFHDDPIALGSYSAIMNGVFVTAAAGNTGPDLRTVSNEAPWLLTVGASTTDRRVVSTLKLGNGLEFDGESLYQPAGFGREMYPLVRDSSKDGTCTDELSLMAQDVRGKIVLCEPSTTNTSVEKGNVVLRAGAVGMVIASSEPLGYLTSPKPYTLPASQVSYYDGQKIKAYVRSAPSPTATFVFRGTVMNSPMSPMIASFSSRGPSNQSEGVLKPDIVGPGVSILAAVPNLDDVQLPVNPKDPTFNIKSGTSMSTPHLSGIAAVIKRAHPSWSPAAIKSAMMTTTDVLDDEGKPIRDSNGLPANYFATGAGHVNPRKALDPGLVYNISACGYVPYLCGLGYSDHQVNSIIHPAENVTCSQLKKVAEKDLNYPSIVVRLEGKPNKVKISRAVTNVGDAQSTYRAVIDAPKGVVAKVKPAKLTFKKVNQERKFTVEFKSTGHRSGTVQGQLKWVSEKHVVRSPIVVSFGR